MPSDLKFENSTKMKPKYPDRSEQILPPQETGIFWSAGPTPEDLLLFSPWSSAAAAARKKLDEVIVTLWSWWGTGG